MVMAEPAEYHSPVTALLPILGRHILALGTVLLSTGVLFLLRSNLNTSTIALLYLLPVLLSTMLWGLAPGLSAGTLAFLTFNYFFIQPYYTFKVIHTQDITALVIFFLVAVMISQLVGRAKKNLMEVEAREQELASLYEISSSLAGINKWEEIARIIAGQIREIFRAEVVAVEAFPMLDEAGINVWLPAEASYPPETPTHIVPMETYRGKCGEIRLWRRAPFTDRAELSMLAAIAAQGALAFERAALAQSETKSRVLEESDRLKSALLSSVSHELRTPLSIIKASATSLLADDVEWEPKARLDLLSVVDQEADHLNQLVGNLLDMSRIEAGVLEPNRQWNMLSEIVNTALQRMRYAVENYRLVVDVSDELPLIPVDFTQFERVFINLISNSTKYAPEGTAIGVSAWVQEGQWMRVQLTNQSPPVPVEHLDAIFEKFHRVTEADRITGAGLGLSICKGIVEAHEGRIWAENLAGEFAFNLLIPLTWNGRSPTAVEAEAA